MSTEKAKSISRVLLIQPWRDSRSIVFGDMEPYALLVLANALQGSGFDVKVLDLRIEKDKLISTIESFKPHMVGLTAITIDFHMASKAISVIKNRWPNIWIAIGGIHATLNPFDFNETPVDIVVRGPGVEILPMIINNINSGKGLEDLNGVIYRNNQGQLVEIAGWEQNIHGGVANFLPNRSLLRYRGRYRCFGYNHAVLVTSQGCTGRCNFCACWPAMAGKYISKKPEVIVAEIHDIVSKGHRHIFLGDDNTFLNIPNAWKTVALLEEFLKKWGRKISLNGYCRADTIVQNPELFSRWAKVGLNYLTVGMESISNSELNQLNKLSTVQINEKANQILQQCGIVNLAHMLINPNFRKDDFTNLWNYIYQNGIVNPIFPVLTGLPGTSLFERGKGTSMYPYFDLGHPIEKTALPIDEFFSSLRRLVFKNYSYRRWLLAKTRSSINWVFALLSLKKPYKLHLCLAPEFLTIPYNRFFYRRITSSKRVREFAAAISE